MKLASNGSLQADSRSLAGEERQTQSVSLATLEITKMVFSALKGFGVFQPDVKVTAEMANSLDGSLKTEISAYIDNGKVTFSLTSPVSNGKVGLTEPMIVSAFSDAVKTYNSTPAVFASVMPEKMPVDLKKMEAERKGSIVVYSMKEQLPFWSMFVEVDALKNPINHSLIASSIISHIRGYILSDYNKIADFSKEPFSLPAPHEVNVQAKLKPADAGFGDIPQTAYEIDQQIALMNLQARSVAGTELPSPGTDDRLYAEQGRVTAAAEAPIKNFIKATLKGASPNIVAYNLSKTKIGPSGNLQGEIEVRANFYSNDGMEEVVLVAPLDDRSLVVADKIVKSKMTLEAEQKKMAELKVLNDAEAKAKFEAFKKQREQDFSAALLSGMPIKASDNGANLFNAPPLQRIPVQRALLPLTANVPGKTIELSGYVYKLYPTNFNTMGCTDPNDSPFLMLVLTDEMPGKADASSIYGSLNL